MRFKTAVTALAVSVLSLGGAMLGASPASASANSVTPLYTNSYQCGGAMDTTQPTAGFVNMQLTGNLLTVIVHIQGEADATYHPSLFATNSPCVPGGIGSLTPVTTNSNGVANERETFLVPGGGSYYVLAYSLDGMGSFLGTPAVAP